MPGEFQTEHSDKGSSLECGRSLEQTPWGSGHSKVQGVSG